MQITLNEKDSKNLTRVAAMAGTIPEAFAVRAIREKVKRIERAIKRARAAEKAV